MSKYKVGLTPESQPSAQDLSGFVPQPDLLAKITKNKGEAKADLSKGVFDEKEDDIS
jgi:hypothetical protein